MEVIIISLEATSECFMWSLVQQKADNLTKQGIFCSGNEEVEADGQQNHQDADGGHGVSKKIYGSNESLRVSRKNITVLQSGSFCDSNSKFNIHRILYSYLIYHATVMFLQSAFTTQH